MMKKRLIFISNFAIILLIVLGTTQVSNAYSTSKAVSYATKWANSRNSSYKDFGSNADCTNFVSQCIVAGGKSMAKKTMSYGIDSTSNTSYWFNSKQKVNKKGIYVYKWKWSSAFNNVGDLHTYWSKKGMTCSNGMNLKTIQTKLKAGDIVQIYDKKHGCYYHSIIITGGKSGNWKYCGHSNNRINKELSSIGSSTTYRYIRIK